MLLESINVDKNKLTVSEKVSDASNISENFMLKPCENSQQQKIELEEVNFRECTFDDNVFPETVSWLNPNFDDDFDDDDNNVPSQVNTNSIEKKVEIGLYRYDLRDRVMQHRVKQTATTSLLKLINTYHPIYKLPNDARTFLKTPRSQNIIVVDDKGGKYWHYGIEKSILNALRYVKRDVYHLNLNINIDGLPMFNSSLSALWPILVQIHEFRKIIPPLVVGVYNGKCKFYLFHNNTMYYI